MYVTALLAKSVKLSNTKCTKKSVMLLETVSTFTSLSRPILTFDEKVKDKTEARHGRKIEVHADQMELHLLEA